MRGHPAIVGDWWTASLEETENTYYFQIIAVIKQRRKTYVVAAKLNASDESFDDCTFGEFTLQEIDLCWFGADGWQINPSMEAFRLLRPEGRRAPRGRRRSLANDRARNPEPPALDKPDA